MKIVCMLWIITFHFADHGILDMEAVKLNINWIILAIARIGGGVGNCIFVLISGYMLIEKRFTIKRIVRLWLEVWFYSVVIGSICYLTGIQEFSTRGIICMLFPVIFNEYWYMSTYVVLYLLYPYINKLLTALKQKEHAFLIVILIFIFSVIPTFVKATWLTGTNNLPVFITLYITGAYIKRYGSSNSLKKGINKNTYFLLFFTNVLIMCLSEIFLKYMNMQPFYFIWEMYKTPVIVTSIIMFTAFQCITIKGKGARIILEIQALVFGIYLIHMGRLSNYVFSYLIDNQKTYERWYLFVQLIISSICIFGVCALVDWIRIEVLERKIMSIFDKRLDKLDGVIARFLP